ncbi:MAG: cupredoxin domain-containing protein [Candidatus Aenigmarchaeota archaeon]|nr:cupredoxin domain-containing protein [Candidatus Aenigmarchaeota archaeon]
MKLLVPLLLGIVLVTGCAAGNSSSETTTTTVSSGSDIKEFEMTAKQFEFVPSTITVNEGDTVRLRITSTDVDHGFSIPAFAVNAQLSVGETKDIEFVADKKGTYTFACSVMCGSGHSGMKGTLVVE